MKRSIPTAVASAFLFIASATLTAARADDFSFAFAGGGVSGSLTLTYGATTDAKYANAFEITGISGTFSDATLGIVNAAVSGLVPITRDTPEAGNLLAPKYFSRLFVASGLRHGSLSFDNLLRLRCRRRGGGAGTRHLFAVRRRLAGRLHDPPTRGRERRNAMSRAPARAAAAGLLATLLVGVAARAQATGNGACVPINEAQVSGLFDRWNDSLRTLDADQVLANYAVNGVLLPTVSNRPRSTPEEIRAYFVKFLKSGPQGRIDQRSSGSAAMSRRTLAPTPSGSRTAARRTRTTPSSTSRSTVGG